MNGMSVYDMVQVERKLALKGLKVDGGPRRRLWRRRVKR
jgi:hypothetical protein